MHEAQANGWYYARSAGGTRQPIGPFTWEGLCARARAGDFGPADLVWGPRLTDWLPARDLSGLFPAAAPVPPPPPPPPPPVVPAIPPASPRRSWLLPVLVPVITLVVVSASLGVYFAFVYGNGDDNGSAGGSLSTSFAGGSAGQREPPATGGGTTSVGNISTADPDDATLMTTQAWGEVPADQVVVILAEGSDRADADRVAEALGGTVVGELEYLDLYQIQIPTASEAELAAAIAAASAVEGVELALPNQRVYQKAEVIQGVRVGPLSDPAYAGDHGKGMELIGAQKAWDYIKASGLDLSPVKVGIVDTGFYKGTGEFGGGTKIEYPDPDKGESAEAETQKAADGSLVPDPTGGHSAGVAGMIGADPTNGRQTGLASPVLGDRLTLSVYDYSKGQRARDTEKIDGYLLNAFSGILKQLENKAQVINCSFGSRSPGPENAFMAIAYRRLFEKVAKENPKVIFVVAAGNESGEVTRTNYAPAGAGSGLPNVVTVGNVRNDGSKAASTNTAGPDGEVTLFAPGDQAVQGVDAKGVPIANGGGTSFATPQVTSTIALIQSLNPELDAAQIKKILVDSTRKSKDGDPILAMDEAVFQVITDLRAKHDPPLPELSREELGSLGVIDAVATGGDSPGAWTVQAIMGQALADGVPVSISVSDGVTVDGETRTTMSGPGTVEWAVAVDNPDGPATATVTRLDTGAASIITWKPLQKSPLDGRWEGRLVPRDAVAPANITLVLSGGLDGKGVARLTVQDEMATWLDAVPLELLVSVEGGKTTVTMANENGALLIEGTLTAPNTLSGTYLSINIVEGGEYHFTWTATRK